LPLRPIFTGDDSKNQQNWPMINMRAKEAESAAKMFMKQKADLVDNDDMFFDAKEYHNANQSVANILSDKTSTNTGARNPQSLSADESGSNTVSATDALPDV